MKELRLVLVNQALRLSEPLGRDTTFNLIRGSTGATYGASSDWSLSVGGTACDDATEANPCEVMIDANDASTTVEVSINDDWRTERMETFTISIEVNSSSMHFVQVGRNSSLLFTIPSEVTNTIRFASKTGVAIEGGEVITRSDGQLTGRYAQINLELTNKLTNNVDITLVIGGNAEDGDYVLTLGPLFQGPSGGNGKYSHKQLFP